MIYGQGLFGQGQRGSPQELQIILMVGTVTLIADPLSILPWRHRFETQHSQHTPTCNRGPSMKSPKPSVTMNYSKSEPKGEIQLEPQTCLLDRCRKASETWFETGQQLTIKGAT